MASARHIFIVGNGDIPVTAATAIDAADLVVRFNECGSYVRGGTRTDIVAICNTGRPAKAILGSQAWRECAPLHSASAIWSVRDPEKFAALRAPLMLSHPELDDFCDDYTAELSAFASAIGKRHEVIDRTVHEATDAALALHASGEYVVPSSGLIVIMAFLLGEARPADTVSITGFSHTGWDGHPFAAEKRLVDSLCADGRLNRLGAISTNSVCQGA
ncbi:Urease operon accessory protein [Rhizobiaceae bacterium n13]|uniref:Urease operon accessory protein n=1 Tax=Ferirhizobium litorale TaxID=2927786 RepID=A0AAE3U0Q6_9HYPH|nr:Urease operon accessory protein [Fererhizobium litorale]MDI7860669.1 Urease operon accessory protein [Fererhizobium litorale]MDI7920817.1 Urease operon accessory protein [Fererhizobium litorale]